MNSSNRSLPLSPRAGKHVETRVSAVIPVYNSRATILAAIDSVKSQSLQCREIIVVDDGSTDDVVALVRESHPDVHLVSQENNGAASARNRGVEIASSPLIAFLDADDLWHPNKIETQVQVLHANQDAVACATDAVVIASDATSVMWSRLTSVRTIRVNLSEVFSNPYLGTPTVMVRRDVFLQAGGFNTSLATAEDIELWLRLAEIGPICRIDAELAAIRPLPSGLSKRDKGGDRRNLLVLESFVDRNPLFAKNNHRRVVRMRSRILCRIGSGCLVRGEREEARTVLWNAVTQDPLNSRAWYLLVKSLR